MERSNYWQRLAAQRLSRRRVLAAGGTMALGGAAGIVVGCGGGGNGSGVRTGGGNVTIGRTTNVLGVDPHIDQTGLGVDRLVYSYLYDWDSTEEELILNNLAKEYENPDGVTFVFTLRQGVMTHPGAYPGANEEMTSEDVRQSFLRRGTSITAPDKHFVWKIAGSRDPAALAPALQAPDRYTFKFTMAEPFVPAIREMARTSWAIVPAKVIDEYGLGLSQRAHGSGPFMLNEFRGNERILLRRHPNYFIEGCPWLDSITFVIITDNDQLLAAFEAGEVDVHGGVVSKEWFDEAKDNPDYRVGRTNAPSYPALDLNIKPPYSDIRVREAIDLALDRDAYIGTVLSGEGQHNGPVPWPLRQWSLEQEELRVFYKHDRNRAQALLDEAGYGAGFDDKLKLPRMTGATLPAKAAALVKEHLDTVGIDAQIDDSQSGFIGGSTILPGNFSMALSQADPIDEPDQALSAYHSRGATGNGNPSGYGNPELDALIEAQSREFDAEKRRSLVYDAQRLIMRDHAPPIPLPSGFEYSAHRSFVNFQSDFVDRPLRVLPRGCDIWMSDH
jgi:peptide/nickel transport system substrate-binding protein